MKTIERFLKLDIHKIFQDIFDKQNKHHILEVTNQALIFLFQVLFHLLKCQIYILLI